IDNVRAEFGAEASVALGTYDTKRRIIHREKSRFDPETTEMDKGGNISTTYSRTLDGKPFLLVDKIVNQHRLLVFGSETGLQLLARSFIVFVDGTFDCCPPGYQQMFSFHVYLSENDVRPVLFALLGDKQLNSYTALLDEITKIPALSAWNPTLLISDYETNIRNSFINKFPLCAIAGCYFHIVQKNSIPYYYDIIVATLPMQKSAELSDYLEYLETSFHRTTSSIL
uniref:MULE domain-containing protein n=1 Tax=Caenorhabditis japonica TaxID=281687 RepID=A0A8R1DPK5_CAEJA